MCDGYLVSLQVHRFKPMAYRVMTYINGKFKHVWASSDKPAVEQKFLRKSVRPNVTPTQRKKVEKTLGKRYVAKHSYWSGTYTVYLPDWASGKAVINHLVKVCESIRIADKDEAKAMIEAEGKDVKQSKEGEHESDGQRAAA